MKFRKNILITTIVLTLAGYISAPMAREPIEQSLIDAAKPLVDVAPGGFFVTAPDINNLIVMNVRVFNNRGEQVLYVRSLGEPVELLAVDLPDGEYRYELNMVFEADTSAVEHGPYSNEAISRTNGQFIIKNTEVVQPEIDHVNENASLMDSLLESAISVIAYSLNPMLSNANAADGQFDDIWLHGGNPEIVFDDHYAYESLRDFSIKVTANASETGGRWALYDEIGVASPATAVIIIDTVADSAIEKSIVVGNNGDLSWANQGMWFDRSSQELSIGTSDFSGDITIRSGTPDVWLQNENTSAEAVMQLKNDRLIFWGNPLFGDPSWSELISVDVNAPNGTLVVDSSGELSALGSAVIGAGVDTTGTILAIGNSGSSRAQLEFVEEFGSAYIEWGQGNNKLQFEGPSTNASVEFDLDAPLNSLLLDSSGNLGMGTGSPIADIHIASYDGNAQILVEELNFSAEPRTLFRLKNNGNAKFGVLNTQANVEWAFANPGTAFRLSRQGSGEVEMEIFNNGNVTIAGTLSQNSDINAKTAITEIDSGEILELVSALPVSKWEYKDAVGETHIGPMAQDFYAAFGLGATDTGISSIDTACVALAAIQALAENHKSLEEENRALKEAVALLQRDNQLLRARQKEQYAELKAMVIDLQLHSQSKGLLTGLK